MVDGTTAVAIIICFCLIAALGYGTLDRLSFEIKKIMVLNKCRNEKSILALANEVKGLTNDGNDAAAKLKTQLQAGQVSVSIALICFQ